MKFVLARVTAAALVVGSLSAFQSTSPSISSSSSGRGSLNYDNNNNHNKNGSNRFSSSSTSRLYDTAQQMTEYLAKAHEEKLRAVKQAETAKNAEIENLKKELKALKSAPGALATVSSSPPPAGMDVSEMTKEQLAQKLASYQQFMAKYIVDSQQQKVKAVATAEMKIRQQYEEKLKLLSGSTTTTTTTTTTSAVTLAATPVVESIPAFDQRSAKVAAAAAAGKSRWGDMENQKVGASTPVAEVVNGAVVNGAVATPVTTGVWESNVNFEKRNVMVAAAGKAGKSRWGEPEVARASQGSASLPGAKSTESSSSPGYVVPPEVEAADHGLRADGGVGGPSLAERVNFGAQLVNGQRTSTASLVTASAPAASSKSTSTTYFDKRNAMVVAAGLAGKSRWGEMEIQMAQSFVAGSLPSSSSSIDIVMTPEIEAADHGLRADGGVGGPSLAQRVNLGAALVSK